MTNAEKRAREFIKKYKSKRQALIEVAKIINIFYEAEEIDVFKYNYWLDVRKEINTYKHD